MHRDAPYNEWGREDKFLQETVSRWGPLPAARAGVDADQMHGRRKNVVLAESWASTS